MAVLPFLQMPTCNIPIRTLTRRQHSPPRSSLSTHSSPCPSAVIIGGGLAGLAAATRLHSSNVPFLLLESSDGLGGRVRTDSVDGFLLDRGFQILLTAYPEARHLLHYPSLELRSFYPGALVFYPDASTVSPIHSAAHLTPSPLSSIPLAHQSTRSLSASTVFAPLFLLFASHPPSKSPSPTASVPLVSPLPSSIAFSALSLRGYSLIPIFLPLLASLTSSSSVSPPATTLFPPAASEPYPLSSQQIYHRHSSACVPRSFP
ncbi:hypothetical protein HPP92_016846 [Vanilla planifolia]|uniref:Amine oxidase domain-containing protein n=1 Tax=Vanilla planifolia TaxID=51239 RepID=A0A835QFY8_VANPL|nr:hypothetical protein HPP92_016846 [Vanilla planifolia]